MAVVYSSTAIDDRLAGVVTAIGNGAKLIIQANGSTVSTIPLNTPVGTVGSQVLTFGVVGTLDPIAAGSTIAANSAFIQDSAGDTIVSGFTVGIPLSGAEVVISNGVNSTVISPGAAVQLLAGQIVGS